MNNKQDLILKITRLLLAEDFSVNFLNKKQKIKYKTFDSNLKEISVYLKNLMGFEFFIHEYSRFIEYKESKSFDENLIFEHNCCIRGIKLLQLNPVENFNIDTYFQFCNLILWQNSINNLNSFCLAEDILNLMPTFFTKNYKYYKDQNNLPEFLFLKIKNKNSI